MPPMRPWQEIAEEVLGELQLARSKYPAMNSAHEGYATILEELDELWDEVKRRPDRVSKRKMRREAIQVAAMAIRFILDVTDKEE